eukprot:SAG11_NODE_3029_length_2753_cov_8.497739_2_plen_108_part_00
MLCVGLQIDAEMQPKLLPRQLFVLRAKPSEVLHTDEWAGKVRTVVNRVDALEIKMDEKLSALQDALETKVDAHDAKLEKILSAIQLFLPEDAHVNASDVKAAASESA